MAYIVPTKRGRFEIRESRTTPDGPRSRTLASFAELTDEAIEKARDKASKPLSKDELLSAARRAGAPVASTPAERAARELIGELAKGEEVEPKLRRLLINALGGGWAGPASAPDDTRAAAEWIAAPPGQRGKALVDLLLLADALPHAGRRGKALRFPRIESKPA